MGKNHSLENFKLWYEDMGESMKKSIKKDQKSEKVSKAKKTTNNTNRGSVATAYRAKFNNIFRSSISKFKNFYKYCDGVVKKALYPSKKAKKLTKIQRETIKNQRANVIMGIGHLLVVVSIAYSTYIVRTFVDTGLSLLSLAPQIAFAVYILLKAFSKLYK